jgi:predicted PurR-regulated permease PerM
MKNQVHPLLVAAGFVIIIAGLRAAAPIVNLVFLAMLLATSVAPVVLWQLHRGWSKGWAILLTILGVVVAGVLTVTLVGLSIASLTPILPVYEVRLAEAGDFLASLPPRLGMEVPDWRTFEVLRPERLVGYAATLLGTFATVLGNALVVLLLVVFLLIDGAEHQLKYDRGLLPAGSWWRRFFAGGADVRRYVSITAWSGLLGAVANLVLLLVLGVDGAGLWAFLSFVFNFIPNFGFILSVVPPALLALLEFGITRALIVVIGFVAVNAVVENVLKPRFVGKELDLSVLEIFLSLLFWGWVLGAMGAILAVPLTIAARKLVPEILAGSSSAASRV